MWLKLQFFFTSSSLTYLIRYVMLRRISLQLQSCSHLLRVCSETLSFIVFALHSAVNLFCSFLWKYGYSLSIELYQVWCIFYIHETVINLFVTAIRSCTLYPFHLIGSNETAACKPIQPTACQKVSYSNLLISLPILWILISYC